MSDREFFSRMAIIGAAIALILAATYLAGIILPALIFYPLPTLLSIAIAATAVGVLTDWAPSILSQVRRFGIVDRRDNLADLEGGEDEF